MALMAIGPVAVLTIAAVLWVAPEARAGWREELGTFRIGMVASPGSGAVVEGARAIRDAYARALGMQVEIFVARDYGALIDAQASSRIEYAIHTASSYAAAFRRCSCIEPIVAPVSADGAIGLRSVLIARADGPRSADDLSQARIAFGPQDSATGFRLPLAGFAPGGVPLTGAEPFLVEVAGETEAEQAFLDGRVNAMFGFVAASREDEGPAGGTLARLAAAGAAAPNVLWASNVLRNGPHAVHTSLASEAKDALRDFLTGLRDTDPDVYDLVERRAAGGFAAVVHADYLAALALVDAVARETLR